MQVDLTQAEQAAFRRAVLQDGLIDIFCGSYLVLWGALMALGQGVFASIWFAVGLPAVRILRRRLVEPRIGHVQLRKRTLQLNRRLLFALFTFTLLLGAFVFSQQSGPGPPPAWLEELKSLGNLHLGLGLAFISTVVGLIFRASRAHLYALGIVALFTLCRTLPLPWSGTPALLALSGVLPLVSGLVLLSRFLKRNPAVEQPDILSAGPRDHSA